MPVRDSLVSRCALLQMESSTMMSSVNKVRRCLFGRPYHEQLKKDLQLQLEHSNSSDFKQMWNFDPLHDQPVPQGRFEWTRVEDNEEIPSFYRKSYKPTKFRSRLNISDCDTCISSPVSSTNDVSRVSEVPDTDTELEEKELQRENETTPEVRTRQTHIVDCMKVKKRRLSDKFSISDDESTSRPAKAVRINVDA